MTTRQHLLQEVVLPGKRLGRHVHHDPQSLAYPFAAPSTPLASVRWSTDDDPILDQGDLGSCTGNATVGALLCSLSLLHLGLTPEQVASLTEALAVKIYSEATTTDPFPGTYPPQDTGSDGLDVAKAAQRLGYISGYSHALSFTAFLQALATGPVIVGIAWLSNFDNPAADGRVTYGGYERGGHEICFDELDVENQRVWFRNSWSPDWGVDGRAYLTFTDAERLLANDGDATILVPVTLPAPTPIPVPPTPMVDPDVDLAKAAHTWLDGCPFFYKKFQKALNAWLASKGM